MYNRSSYTYINVCSPAGSRCFRWLWACEKIPRIFWTTSNGHGKTIDEIFPPRQQGSCSQGTRCWPSDVISDGCYKLGYKTVNLWEPLQSPYRPERIRRITSLAENKEPSLSSAGYSATCIQRNYTQNCWAHVQTSMKCFSMRSWRQSQRHRKN